MPMYNLPDVYSTTSTVPSTANLQVVAACSVWLSVNMVATFIGEGSHYRHILLTMN
jgi:hypothetical protein